MGTPATTATSKRKSPGVTTAESAVRRTGVADSAAEENRDHDDQNEGDQKPSDYKSDRFPQDVEGEPQVRSAKPDTSLCRLAAPAGGLIGEAQRGEGDGPEDNEQRLNRNDDEDDPPDAARFGRRRCFGCHGDGVDHEGSLRGKNKAMAEGIV